MSEEEKKEKAEEKEKPDRLEAYVKFVGIIGGLIAAFIGIYQLWQGNVQSGRELRWKQAEMAREMVNKMMADEGWKAMEMMDWDDEGREYEINGQKQKINANTVYSALEKHESTDEDRYIIDRLDRAFFLVSQLEASVRSDLIKLEDVRFPLSWYAAKRMCPRKQLFEAYMKENAAPETLEFFQRLDEWRNCK
ncbi:MAG TPA: hypothetical protein VJT09_13040 [Pyrinomonadaceae bacterium]|nr:hypothetical protein [Pyrinomonadaceae bacterium]